MEQTNLFAFLNSINVKKENGNLELTVKRKLLFSKSHAQFKNHQARVQSNSKIIILRVPKTSQQQKNLKTQENQRSYIRSKTKTPLTYVKGTSSKLVIY